MSLENLRTLRRAGKRPDTVTVIVGSADVDDSAGIVQIPESPESMDLRPLIGLQVHIIDVQADPARTLAVIEALERIKAKPLGFCGPAGSCGVSADHEHAMQLYRETLCKS